MTRNANAIWTGDLKGGEGRLSSGSKVLSDSKYSFRTRFEGEPGTNPEELIAAAHAGCFAMATVAGLGEAGITPERVEVSCDVTMENLKLTKSELKLTVKAPGADKAKVEQAAQTAKAECPISKALNLEISLDADVQV